MNNPLDVISPGDPEGMSVMEFMYQDDNVELVSKFGLHICQKCERRFVGCKLAYLPQKIQMVHKGNALVREIAEDKLLDFRKQVNHLAYRNMKCLFKENNYGWEDFMVDKGNNILNAIRKIKNVR